MQQQRESGEAEGRKEVQAPIEEQVPSRPVVHDHATVSSLTRRRCENDLPLMRAFYRSAKRAAWS